MTTTPCRVISTSAHTPTHSAVASVVVPCLKSKKSSRLCIPLVTKQRFLVAGKRMVCIAISDGNAQCAWFFLMRQVALTKLCFYSCIQ